MTEPEDPEVPPRPGGGLTSPRGTPVAVDLSRDRRERATWLVLTLGPVTWFAHFMLVYLVAEAGCTGDGPGLAVLDPPVPVVTTLAATVVAVAVCAVGAVWGWRWWRRSERDQATDEADPTTSEPGADLRGADGTEPTPEAGTGPLAAGLSPVDAAAARRSSVAFVGALLSIFSLVAVLFTAAPALVLGSC